MSSRSARLLGALAIAALMALAATPALAAIVAGSTYKGTASDSSTVTFQTSPDGKLIERFEYRFLGLDCSGGIGFSRGPTGEGTFSLSVPPSAQTRRMSVAGYYGVAGAMAGAVSADPVANTGCAPVRTTFTAEAAGSSEIAGPGLQPGITYTGQVTGLSSFGGIGEVTLVAGADGASIDRLTVRVDVGNCHYETEYTSILLAGKKMFQAGLRTPLKPQAAPSISGVLIDGAHVSGGFGFPPQNTSSCGGTLGRWYVAASTLPAATPPGSAVSGFAGPPQFGSGGLAFTVFVGGAVDDLEDAARSVGAAAAWVQAPDGEFALLVVGGPDFLKDQFAAKFPEGLPPNLPVTLTR